MQFFVLVTQTSCPGSLFFFTVSPVKRFFSVTFVVETSIDLKIKTPQESKKKGVSKRMDTEDCWLGLSESLQPMAF